MDDAAGHGDIRRGGQVLQRVAQMVEHRGARHDGRIVVDLKRSDAGREIEQAVNASGLNRAHQRVDAQANGEAELGRADLDQQIVEAGLANHHDVDAGDEPFHDGAFFRPIDGGRLPRYRQMRDRFGLGRCQRRGLGVPEALETDVVAGRELADLPELGLCHRHGPDEAAK